MSWLQQFTSSSADLLMMPAERGTSACCRVSFFSFIVARRCSVLKKLLYETGRGGEKGKKRWETKARTDVVRVWGNLNVLLWQPVASSFLCISVSFRQTHCVALSVKPKAQQERNKREAHVKLNWHLITAAGSQQRHQSLCHLTLLSYKPSLIIYWAGEDVMSACHPHGLCSAPPAPRTRVVVLH